MNRVTMVWPLPPIKWGISDYCKSFVFDMEKLLEVEFFGYDHMYPKVLYPGWDYKIDSLQKPKLSNTIIKEKINRYNPFSWISVWMSISWEVLHIQYWIWFLAPIIITINFIARYIKKVPVVMTIHNVIPHEIAFWKIRIDKIVYRTATSFIVHSEKNKQDLIEIIWNKKSIEVFPIGILPIDIERISKSEARQILNIKHDKKVILSVGNIRPYKGLWITLEILAELIKKDKDYILIIAWKCREDRNLYQKSIDSLELGDHILRIPWFLSDEQMNQVFCASDLQLFTYTHFDAQSASLATGLDYDIPMIVSNLGGLTDVIDDEQYIIDIQDLSGGVVNIDKVFDNLDGAIKFIKERKKEYSWDEITLKTLQYYKNFV